MPTKRPTAWCDTCESTVYADDVHSCYDAKRVRAVAEAERTVVEAADNWLAAADTMMADSDEDGSVPIELVALENAAMLDLKAAVRALRAVRGQGGSV